MPHWEFPASGPIDLSAQLAVGNVSISAEPTSLITVDVEPTKSGNRAQEHSADVIVKFDNGQLQISEPPRSGWIRTGTDITIIVPTGTHATIDTASASITCDGELGSLDAKSASGEIRAAFVTGETQASSTSGKVQIGEGSSAVSLKTSSGAIDLGRAGGDLYANSVSGKIQIGSAESSAQIHSSSGTIRIERLGQGQADINTVSGDVKVKVAPRIGVYLDLASVSGKVTNDLLPSDGSDQVDLHLSCRTISGSVRVARAEAANLVN
jgi:DUF4097 and DUF4098 domain-containing protein YvlB